eukprot:3527902-Ditylum_brightwellii.AAC.1
MRQQGVVKPKPMMVWIHDITPKLKEWAHEGEVILIVDANSGLDNSDFATFVADIGMCDMIGGHHSIDALNTHIE